MKRAILATTFVSACAGLLISVGHSQTPLPAPTIDRIGFPAGYRDTFKKLFSFDRPSGNTVRVIWGNDEAASVKNFSNQFFYPYGAVFIMESWSTKKDAQGTPILDDNGRFVPDTLGTIFVMAKQPGFGPDYKELRNGEWEYVAYRPDGSYANTPSTTGGCAQCHLEAGQWKDWVFRANLFQKKASGALPTSTMQNYLFIPANIQVKAGDTFTIYNDDDIKHNIVADDRSFASGDIFQGDSFSVKLTQAGEVAYHCTLHSNMKGKITVVPATTEK
jgi:plastocyanin